MALQQGKNSGFGAGLGFTAIAACLLCGLPVLATVLGLTGVGISGAGLGSWLAGAQGTLAISAGLLLVVAALALWFANSKRRKKQAQI